MLRIAALASSVVASIAHRAPHHQRGSRPVRCNTQVNDCLMGLRGQSGDGCRDSVPSESGGASWMLRSPAKRANAQRVGGAPRDRLFRIQPCQSSFFNLQPEIPSHGARLEPTDPVRVERRALCLTANASNPASSSTRFSRYRKTGCPALFGVDPPWAPASSACRVRPQLVPIAIARQCRTQDRSCRSLERGTFTTGC